MIKVNKPRYIALFVVSGSIKKLFSIDCVNIYLFSVFFFSLDFAQSFHWLALVIIIAKKFVPLLNMEKAYENLFERMLKQYLGLLQFGLKCLNHVSWAEINY